jgi:hypothetical protein
VRLRDEFRAYTDNAFKNYAPFTKDETVAIRCMHVLQDEGAPATYDDIMEWHLKETKPSPATKHLAEVSYAERVFKAAKTLQCKPRLVQHYKTKDTPSSKSTVNICSTLVPL